MKSFYLFLIASIIATNLFISTNAFAREQTGILGYYTNRISAGDMSPTLSRGDLILSDSDYYGKHPILRRDVVLINSPKKDGSLWVKRIIGLPGEKVTVTHGKIYINSKELMENYVLPQNNRKISENMNKSTVLGKNQYYVLGDNRDNSFDSRFFGPINKSEIRAKVLIIYYSSNHSRIGRVK